MDVLRSLQAVANAPRDGHEAVRRAAKATTEPGPLDLSAEERDAYARDLAAARERVDADTTMDVSPPDELVILDRHQWIDTAIDRQRAVHGNEATGEDAFAETLPDRIEAVLAASRVSVRWSTAAAHVVGRYDYVGLSAMGVEPDGSVAVVHPNVVRAAGHVDEEYARLRRWVVFTQTAYAAILDAIRWLPEHLRTSLLLGREDENETAGDLHLYRPFLLLDGYVQHLLERMFDGDVDGLRRSFYRNRWNRDLPTGVQRVRVAFTSGGSLHEIGLTFFEAIADARGPAAVDAVWEAEENLPTWEELGGVPSKRWWRRTGELSGDDYSLGQWLDRVDP